MANPEKRRQKIIETYGSWEKYEMARAKKLRETALARCKTDEERQKKLETFKREDFWKASVIKDNIGKSLICTRCGKPYIAKANQHLYCPRCVLALARIRRSGSLTDYFSDSSKKSKETKLERYGDEGWNNRNQAKETCLERYGVDHAYKTEEVKARSKETKELRYGDASYNNRTKAKQTCQETYGVDHNWKDPQVRAKCRITAIQKYGTANNTKKRMETDRARFGGNAPICSRGILSKIDATMKQRYGARRAIQVPELRDKISATKMARYGTTTPCCTYYFEGLIFDSSWELAYYIYLRDKKTNFIYKPDPVPYLDGQETRLYYPDFMVDGVYVEIKGDHLIKDGIILGYNGEPLYSKTKCLRSIGAIIKTKSDLLNEFTHIDETYGKGYLKKFRVQRLKRSVNDENTVDNL